MEPVRVVLADDHEVVRKLIHKMLVTHPDIEVVAEAANGVDAIDQVRNHSPDVLVLDLQMPVLNGVGVVRSLQEEQLPVEVLMISTHDDPHYIRGVMKCGVAGYLTKDEVQDQLVGAVMEVAGDR